MEGQKNTCIGLDWPKHGLGHALTGALEDEVIVDIMDHHYMGLFTCVPILITLA